MRFGTWALTISLFIRCVPAAQQATPAMHRAVEEFRVETRKLGIRPESPVRASRLRPPGQTWHGRLYENFRNDALDAVPHEIRQRGGDKGLLRRNQFGFNVAGPVVFPHILPPAGPMFFSVSYEGVRERISRTFLDTIPTINERTGDFSAVVDQAGNPLPIYDPASTRLNPAFDPSRAVSESNLQYIRDPFPDNRIPANRLDPVAQRALQLYPQANTAVGPFFRNNYFIDSPEANTANGMIGKLDRSLRDRHRLTVELAFSNGVLGASRWFPTGANPGPPDRRFSSRRGTLEHIFTLSPRTVNTASFESRSEVSQSTTGDSTNYGEALGLAGAAGAAFPVIGLDQYLGMGHSSPESRSARNTYHWMDALSTRLGRHNLRFVGQYRRDQTNVFSALYPSGDFRFSAGLTSLPGIINTGHAFASFLLGLSEYAQRSVVPSPSYFRHTEASFAVRDRYEGGRGLTITVGLTLQRNTPRVEKYNRQSTVDLKAIDAATGMRGALVAAARNGYGRSFQPARLRLEPSVNIAWSPRGDSATVARLSFARWYAGTAGDSGQWGIQGFSANPTYISPNTQLEPALVLSQGVPPLATPLPDLAPSAADFTVADLVDASTRQPTYQSASLSVERQLPGAMLATVGVSYAGGRNLLVGNRAANPNAIPLDALRFRDQLNDEDFNASLRPYQQYKGFNVHNSYALGSYQRDAVFLRVEKRTSKGLSLSAYYEFAKQLDDYSGPYGTQDFYNRRGEWARTPWRPPQNLQLSYVYELPMGTAFLNSRGWRKHIVEGWSISGMAAISSGTPIALRPEFNNTGNVVQALHVNAVPGVDARVPNQGPDLWFNPAAFDQPADFTIGNVSRTLPDLFNPGRQNYDLSLNKRIALASDRSMEFSAAGFNFLNHANWDEPDNVIGPASAPNVNAGKIIGSRGGRVIQLGLRFSF